MKKITLRMLSVVLVLAIFAGIFLFSPALVISAQTEEGTRFIFESLSASGKTYHADGEPLLLTLESSSQFTANGFSPMESAGATNSVYISLINCSAASELIFTYEYLAYTPQTATVKKILDPQSEELQTVVLNVPYIDSATGFTLSFNSGEGTVELHSLFNISVHEHAFDEVIAVDVCRYNLENNSIEISGSIGWETTVLYSGAMLALFALNPSEDIYLLNKTPVARTGISFSFDFSVPVESVDDIFYRYVIAAITTNGERIPLTTPYYPSVSETAAETTGAFKGVHTGNFEDAISAGAESAIVDVYLDRVMSAQNGGILYAGDHSYYYFNAEYIETTDTAIRNLSGAGCRVYLRFLISPDANNLSFVSYTQTGEVVFGKGISIQDEDALLTVYALTDFLTLRYSDDTFGCITGIILGQTVNRSALYNRSDAQTLAKDTELYAAAFSLISGVACRNIPGLSMVVPLSDSRIGETVDSGELTGDYPADLYLYSFLEVLSDYYLDSPAVSVFIESEAIPETLTGIPTETYDADHFQELQTLFKRFASEYPNFSEAFGYVWHPDASVDTETLQSAYALLFTACKLSENVSCFFVNTTRLSAQKAAAVQNGISYLMQYFDTELHVSVLKPVLSNLGVSGMTELFPAYMPEQFIRRRIFRLSLTENEYENITPIGSYQLWNFAVATNTLDWYQGSGCGDLSVLSGNNGNLLTAHLTFDGDFSVLSHRFIYGKDLSFAPYLRFEMGMGGSTKAQYEVQVQLLGPDALLTASTVLTAGEQGVFCLNLSTIADYLSDVTCIRFCIRPLDGSTGDCDFRLRSVTLQSTIYDDNELKAQISASNTGEEPDGEEAKIKDYAVPIIVTAAILLASVSVTALLVIRYKNNKYKNNKNQRETDER